MVFTQAKASNPSSARPRVPFSPLGWVPPAALPRQPFGRAPPTGGPVQARTGKRTSLGLTLLAPPTSAPELQALALAAKLASKSQTSLQLQKEVQDAPQRGIATVPQCALGWTAQRQAMPFGFARIDPSLGGVLQLLHRPWRKQTVPCGHSSSVSAAAITPSGLQRCTHCSYSTSRMHRATLWTSSAPRASPHVS